MKGVTAIALLFVLFGASCNRSNFKPEPVVAPIEFVDLSGTRRLLPTPGLVTVVNFWATWCGPCVGEMPHLQKLSQEFDSQGVVFVGVSTDFLDAQEVEDFLGRLGISYPVTMDDESIEPALGPLLGLPTTVVIDANGSEFRRITGAASASELRSIVQAALSKRAT